MKSPTNIYTLHGVLLTIWITLKFCQFVKIKNLVNNTDSNGYQFAIL